MRPILPVSVPAGDDGVLAAGMKESIGALSFFNTSIVCSSGFIWDLIVQELIVPSFKLFFFCLKIAPSTFRIFLVFFISEPNISKLVFESLFFFLSWFV